ncbi:MAG TPA: hypothetical protein VHB51_04400 [Candidatus Saccharimonadales bacterium]|nr:hypothetical protein [Candidatus Saccharimonadales bacterium]
MKVVVLYRPNSEQGRQAEEYIHEFQHRYKDINLEALNVDSREGVALASLYDVLQYPAILVLQDNGSVQSMWQGDPLPLMDEVFAYAHSQA